MNYILKGDPKEIAKVLQENRIRVDRGVIAFTPCQPASALDEDSIKTLVESHTAMSEERQRLVVEKLELADLAGLVVSIAVEGGQAIPEDIAERLAKFGIVVPKIAETVPNNPETVEDSKTVEAEDVTEVNLDDVKDAPEEDTKEAPAPTLKKKRAKKSE